MLSTRTTIWPKLRGLLTLSLALSMGASKAPMDRGTPGSAMQLTASMLASIGEPLATLVATGSSAHARLALSLTEPIQEVSSCPQVDKVVIDTLVKAI